MTGLELRNKRLAIITVQTRRNRAGTWTIPLTQAALAKALGVSTKTVASWETEASPIPPLKVAGIEAALNRLRQKHARQG